MTAQELQHFAWAIAQIALAAGFLGGVLWGFMLLVIEWVVEALGRRGDQAMRILDARWRAHWNKALREAREAGYKGRRAIAYAANSMKTRREAIAELGLHG